MVGRVVERPPMVHNRSLFSSTQHRNTCITVAGGTMQLSSSGSVTPGGSSKTIEEANSVMERWGWALRLLGLQG